MNVPLFPLHRVLFPGGPLPLRIFEPRYLSMVADCLRERRPFGVVLITQGEETGPAARFHPFGTLAEIRDWNQEGGLLAIDAVGTRRFRVREHRIRKDGLVLAGIEPVDTAPRPLPPQWRPQAEWLGRVLSGLPAYRHLPRQPEDADWVGFRLAELLLKPSQCQIALEQSDPIRRLEQLARHLPAPPGVPDDESPK